MSQRTPKDQSEALEQGARKILEQLRREGYQAFFAGGCVRDRLRGLPAKDIDVATDALPKVVEQLFPRHHSVGAHFGVVVVHMDGFLYEVATFRTDGVYGDGRRPDSVHFTNAREDAERRDFTINGMFYDPLSDEVIDYVGGRQDLDNGVIRAIGHPEQRFSEDALRLLRAIRFATTLQFVIEPQTWEALRAQANTLHRMSPERIREELVRILESPERLRGFDLMDQSGLLKEILPEVEALKGCEQPAEFHPEGDVFVHTRLMLSMLPPDATVPLVLAILLHDIGKPPTRSVDPDGRIRFNGHDRVGAEMTHAVMRRLRFSRREVEQVEQAVRSHMIFKDVKEMRPAKLKRFMAREGFEDELELHRVDCLSSHGLLDNYEFLRRKQEEFSREPLIPPPLLTGRDLLAMGLQEGPEIGKLLGEVQTLQLEGSLKSPEEALAWVRQQSGRVAQTPGIPQNPHQSSGGL